MLTPQANDAAAAPLPLWVAADLQDHLMTASNDLDRLQGLLAHACEELMQGFYGANAQIDLMREHATTLPDGEAVEALRGQIAKAVTALQFQDMASQLIHHTHTRLRSCAQRIARDAMGDDEDGESPVEDAPLRPNPVTQDEMDAGSVELF